VANQGARGSSLVAIADLQHYAGGAVCCWGGSGVGGCVVFIERRKIKGRKKNNKKCGVE